MQRRGLGDLDHQAAGKLGLAAEQRGDRTQPRIVGRGQPGDVEPEADAGIGGDLGDGALEHVAVDRADESQLLDDRHEVTGGDIVAVLVDHAEQAFVVVDGAGIGDDHWLECEDQPVVAQRALHAFSQRHAEPVLPVLLLRQTIGNEAVAAGTLGLGERGLGARHHLVARLGLLGKGGAADRDRSIDRA